MAADPVDWETALSLLIPDEPSLAQLEAARGAALASLDWLMHDQAYCEDPGIVASKFIARTIALSKLRGPSGTPGHGT
jgi:hypothetical protein